MMSLYQPLNLGILQIQVFLQVLSLLAPVSHPCLATDPFLI